MRIIPIKSQNPSTARVSPDRRYRIRLSRSRCKAPVLSVFDRSCKRRLFVWTGSTVDRLVELGALDDMAGKAKLADKSFVSHLALLAASGHTADLAPATPPDRIASMLRSKRPLHLSEEEIVWLTSMENPCLTDREVRQYLCELVSRGVLQRIKVKRGVVFYDSNTEPHLHIYDERTRELRDAPVDGVVRTRSTLA